MKMYTKIVTVMFLLIVSVGTISASEVCTLGPNNDGFLELRCAKQPLYYVILHSEPNWCEYNTADIVYMKINLSVPNSVATAWYVVPRNTFHTPIPPGFWSQNFFVYGPIGGQCGLSPF